MHWPMLHDGGTADSVCLRIRNMHFTFSSLIQPYGWLLQTGGLRSDGGNTWDTGPLDEGRYLL